MQNCHQRVGFWKLLFHIKPFPALGCDGTYEFAQVIMLVDTVGLEEELPVWVVG